MRERGVLVVALFLVLVAFLSTGFSSESLTGYAVRGPTVSSDSCDEDLFLLDRYVVPCENGDFQWDQRDDMEN